MGWGSGCLICFCLGSLKGNLFSKKIRLAEYQAILFFSGCLCKRYKPRAQQAAHPTLWFQAALMR
ncbi:hypothetical protein [Kingella sp. (in: b-proteobacteria)]|uniref:hypothetical protein n=1 Tax=Kingella sp. (in: b-proteobacteria) TaxID=2020713 RepID=UPI0026DD0200|nr:hypothetical protein [Kingella sp. (in: b-proteobacteria)]